MTKKPVLFLLTISLLILSVYASLAPSQILGWAVSVKQGDWEVKALCTVSSGTACETTRFIINPQGYIQGKSLSFLSEASPELDQAITAVTNPSGFLTQTALAQIAKDNPETAKGLSEALTTIDRLKALGINDGDVKLDSKGVVTEAKFAVKEKEGQVGDIISKDLKKEEVLIIHAEVEKKEGITTLTFTQENGYVKVKDNLFVNVKKGGTIRIDERGEVVEADIMSNKQGVFTFGTNTVAVGPDTRVTYKDGQVKVYGAGKSFELSQTIEGRKSEIGEITILEGDSVTISGNKVVGKSFEGEGFKVKGMDDSLGEVTFSGNKIVGIGRNTDAMIQGVEHKTFDKDLNLYYDESFDPKEHRGENYFNYGKNKLTLGGHGFKTVFDGTSPVVNIYTKGDKDDFLEVSPQHDSVITIENRNAYRESGLIDTEETQAPKMVIQGDNDQQVWAELKDNGNTLIVGKEGIIKYRLLRGPEGKTPIQVEINMVDEEGKSVLLDPEGRELKASIDDYGTLKFATVNAKTNIYGEMGCGPISDDTCKDDYFAFERVYSSKAAVEAAKEEYEKNVNKKHDFKPEPDNTLESITMYYKHVGYVTGDIRQYPEERGIEQTQIDILNQLPAYTKIKLFVRGDEDIEFLRKELPEDVFNRITFLKPGYWGQYTVWAQDFTEGDSKVQILPLTYLGGGRSNTPDMPENEFIYQLEKVGTEVRKVPVEFGGGNIFIAKDANGKKILLTGSNDYLSTKNTYDMVESSISEEEFKTILKNAFNVDEVTIVGTRDSRGALEDQPVEAFHIDQVMLPLGDGIVAMPTTEGIEEPYTKRYVEEVREMMKQKGFKVIDLKTSQEAVEKYQAYTNGIVYTDKITGEKTVMMPVFPDKNGEYKMEGLNEWNKKAFERAGFKVKIVKDRAFYLYGNIHCITILAKNPQHPPACPLA